MSSNESNCTIMLGKYIKDATPENKTTNQFNHKESSTNAATSNIGYD